MPKFQLLSAHINIGGNHNHTVVRGIDRPLTLAEITVLQGIHGEDAVHTIVEIGREERDTRSEVNRLAHTYGGIVGQLFPMVGSKATLPLEDDSFPTIEEVRAGEIAAREAREKVRTSKKPKAHAKAAPAADAGALDALIEN
nr:hypothetical protein [uncultured Cohaesibacter sp.]